MYYCEENSYTDIPLSVKENYFKCMKDLKEGGITYFAHGILLSKVRTCYFSHEDWGATFINNHFYEKDPYTLKSEGTDAPYIFWDEVEKSEEGLKIDALRKEICNISSGITFSVHFSNYHEIIALGTSHKLLDMKALAFNNSIKKALTGILIPARKSHLEYRLKTE